MHAFATAVSAPAPLLVMLLTVSVGRGRSRHRQHRVAIDVHLHQRAMLRAEQQVFDRRRAERRALPCEDCGTEHAGGLCGSCWAARSIRTVVDECVDPALAASADLADHRNVNAVALRTEAELRAAMAAARPGREDALGSDLETARDAVNTYGPTPSHGWPARPRSTKPPLGRKRS
ncbi:hypothetical protein ABTX81_33030 [Kitasatospora sp. NPDC097605]|uniref:hypothetical protein n=1 Tax=Kitasatospora sp. NPDC097605 TaxID=3157226 RepID=UPI00332B5C1A